jgi:hypothetical protein
MPATRFVALAHTRSNYAYSVFHQSLLHENNSEDYALKHLYSLENTKVLLDKWGWTSEQIKVGIDNATIDVYERVVWLHIPGYILKKGDRIKIRGISRFISKADYVQVLIDRAWSKADPYKLQLGNSWDEFVVMGNAGDFYEVNLTQHEVTCTCHAYRGLRFAFEQDAIATKHLISNPITQGQLPDKHIFAIWKYLGVETLQQYEYQFMERRDRFLEETALWEWEPLERNEEIAIW